MKKFFLIISFLSAFTLSAQKPAFSWARMAEGSQFFYSTGSCLATDTAGNVYTGGYFEDTIDLEPGTGNHILVSKGEIDMFITKTSKSGTLLWSRSIGSYYTDGILDIAVDLAGNVYAAGAFSDTVDFDPDTLATHYLYGDQLDACVFKLNSLGVFQWVKYMSGPAGDVASGIKLDAAGNVYSCGYFEEEIEMNPAGSSNMLTAGGFLDGWICKLSNSGAIMWAKQFEGTGGSSFTIPVDLALDATGNIYYSGTFSEDVDFNPGAGTVYLNTAGDDDVFITKLDNNGGYMWAKQVGGSDYETVGHIALDGSIPYITGAFQGTVDFNPGAGTFNMTSSDDDAFVLKLDASGNFAWAKKTTGDLNEAGHGIAVDASKNVWISGVFSDSVDFDPSGAVNRLYAIGDQDMFLLKLTQAGAFSHVQQFGGTSAEVGNIDLALNSAGAVYLTGSAYGTVDLDPSSNTYNLSSVGYDAILVKLQQCIPTSNTIVANGCSNVTVNGQLYTLSGTYTQTLQNSTGCDSILTIKVTLKNSAFTINASACSSYTLNSQTYTASGTYKQTLTNYAGCDSTLTLNLKILKSADSITRSACNTITINGQTYTSSGTYIQTLTNHKGCDSTLTIFLTIGSQNTSSTINRSACYTFTYLGTTYTSSGTYNKTIANSAGCDSNITLKLTIYDTSRHALSVTACRSYRLNGQNYSSTGTYVQKLVNFRGCDSLLTLNLTINNANKTVTQAGAVLTSNATGTYKWVDCNNGKQPIPGQTAKTFTATLNGSYAVIVTENNCTDTSVCFNVSGLSVSEIPSAGINIYPNPAAEFVHVQLQLPVLNGRLQLFNTAGVLILDQAAHGSRFLVDVSDIMPGIYQVVLRDADREYRSRLVINSEF